MADANRVLDSLWPAMLVLDATTLRVQDATVAASRLLGRTREELLAASVGDLIASTEALAVTTRLRDLASSELETVAIDAVARTGRRPVTVHVRKVTARPGDRDVLVLTLVAASGAGSSSADPPGAAPGIVAWRSDWDRSLFDASHAVMLLVDPATGRVADANSAACAFYGYDRAAFTRLPISAINLLPHDDLAEALRAAREGPRRRFEFRHRLASGEVRDVEVASGPLTIDGHELLFSIVTDVTMRRLAEERAQRLQRLYDALVEMGRMIGRTGDARQICQEICRLAVEAAGFHAAWVGLLDAARTAVVPLGVAGPLTREIEIIRVEVARPADQGMLNTALHEGRTVVVDDAQSDPLLASWQDRVATVGYRSAAGLPIMIDGQVAGLGFFCAREAGAFGRQEVRLLERVMDDLAFRLQALRRDEERRVTEAERDRLVTAVEQATDAILMTDAAGRIAYLNPAFTAILGYTREQALGHRPRELLRVEGQGPELYRAMDHASEGGAAWAGRVRNRCADGATREFDLVISPLRDPSGAWVGTVEVGRDVSLEVALEAQLRQAQKLEAIGRLAGGIAHDFNNQLTAIIGFGGLLEASMPPGGVGADDLAQMLRSAERAAMLTRQLLAFSRRSVLDPRVVDLAAVLASVSPMLRRLIGEDIELDIRSAPDIGRAIADPSQLEQVVMNLAVNARDAMPDGGRLTIEVANASVDEESIATHADSPAGPWVTLTVSDTGHGMPPEVLSHLFEPFFTTKAPGKGTGLGLSTVFGIVEQSGGRIAVESRPGDGSRFRIYLPRVDQPLEAHIVDYGRPEPRGRGETILVVEDEDVVRTFVARVLERTGYHVLAAANGGEAIELAAAYDGPIDLLLSDIVMPGLAGPEVGRRLRAARPDLRLLYTSGYADEATLHDGVLGPGVPFLQKPYTAGSMLSQVRRILDEPPTTRRPNAGNRPRVDGSPT